MAAMELEDHREEARIFMFGGSYATWLRYGSLATLEIAEKADC